MTEPDWDSPTLEAWGDPSEWPPQWHAKAKAALIRHFSRIDITVEYEVAARVYRISMPDRSPQVFTGSTAHLQADAYLAGFLAGCERMAVQWDCRERAEVAG